MYSFQLILPPVAADMASVFYKAVALGFLVSAWVKFREIEAFRLICANYPGAASIGVRAISSVVIFAEFTLGAAMLTPHHLSNLLGLAAALLWIAAVTAAVALRRFHGEKRFRCGCGMDLSEESSAGWLLVRNALIMIGLAVAAVGGNFSTNGFRDVLSRDIVFRDTMMQLMAAVSLLLGMRLLAAAVLTWRKVKEWRTVG
jgi:hypothetical protein